MTCRTKSAPYSATCLRRNTKRASLTFRNKDSLYRISAPYVEQPFNSAISRYILGNKSQLFDMSRYFELLTKRLGEIRHLIKIGGAFLMNPAKQLYSPVALFSKPLTKNGQALEVVIE